MRPDWLEVCTDERGVPFADIVQEAQAKREALSSYLNGMAERLVSSWLNRIVLDSEA